MPDSMLIAMCKGARNSRLKRESESLSLTLSIVNEDVVIDGDDDDDDDLEDTTRNHVLCHR